MACNAHHIPGPDAHQRVMHLWLQHTPAALSKSKFIGLSPRFEVNAFTSNAVFFQHDLLRSENDAIIGMNASKVSH